MANSAAWTHAVRSQSIPSRVAGTDRAILEAIKACDVKRVLDIGCGEGWLVHRLLQDGYDAAGIDGSPDLMIAARGSGSASNHFRTLTYEQLIANPEVIDVTDAVVFNFALFEENIRPLLGAVRSRLRPGGFLLIQTVHPFTTCGDAPYRDGWREETFEDLGDGFVESMPWYFRTFATWHADLSASGFRVVRCIEPRAGDGERPLSLILVGQAEI